MFFRRKVYQVSYSLTNARFAGYVRYARTVVALLFLYREGFIEDIYCDRTVSENTKIQASLSRAIMARFECECEMSSPTHRFVFRDVEVAGIILTDVGGMIPRIGLSTHH